MKPAYLIAAISFALSFGFSESRAQCDSLALSCERYINTFYISDGQAYRALLTGADIAEFQTTLFGGNVYRIAACTGGGDSNLIVRLYDVERNLLFSNTEYGNSAYWDFALESTMHVTIEASLDETRLSSGCAALVIGFRK
jgi:hypothetical protein